MSALEAHTVHRLRELAEQVSKLADDLEAGKLWPGQLHDGLRAAHATTSELERAVRDSRPRVSRSNRW